VTVLDQAQNIGGVVSAARARERWQQREAKATNEEEREQYREAIADLEARFPELEEINPGGAESFARERGHGKSSHSPSHEGRQRPGAKKRAASPSSSASSKSKPSQSQGGDGSQSPATKRGRSRRRQSRGGGRARHAAGVVGLPTPYGAWRQTGIPSGVGSGTSLVMSMLGAVVGLSLLYLVLNSGERGGKAGAALPQLLGSVTGWLQRFIGTGDILGGGTAYAAGAAGPSYSERALAGEVAGPPNLPGMLPDLQPLPPVRGQRAVPNPRLREQTRMLPRVLPQPRR
jgi:hypothetical protein